MEEVTILTGELIQAAWIAYLKSQTSITSLLLNSLQIKELEYQGDSFVYPGIRVSLDLMPGDAECFPDRTTVYIDVFSEEKSSKQAAHLAGAITTLLRTTDNFTQNGVKVFYVQVVKVKRPDRIESGAWQSHIEIDSMASG
jgi:hypothetical protein